MVSDDYVPAHTGVGIQLHRLTSELVRRGHEIVVITTKHRGQPEKETHPGITIYRLFTIKAGDFHVALPRKSTVAKIIKAHSIDIMHYHYMGYLCHIAHKAARSFQVRHMYTFHMLVDHLMQGNPLLLPFRRLIEKRLIWFCNQMDGVTAPSSGLAEQISKMGISSRTQYLPVSAEIQKSSQKPFTILFVGRLHPEKNISTLIKAFALAIKQDAGGAWKLRIAGKGFLQEKLEKLVQKLGIVREVEFLGFLPQSVLADVYRQADIFVLPSYFETLGMVAVEAMVEGTPILVSRSIVSVKDLVEEGVNGFSFAPDSLEELCHQMISLKQDTKLYGRLSQGALEKVKDFQTEAVANLHVSLYQKILST